VSAELPLSNLKVLELATVFAGPIAGMLLGDIGADVIKIEHPRGDTVRTHGASKNGVGLWWKLVARNKKCITLYLGTAEGQAIFRKLVADADVVIENFRPGTLERWNLGWDELSAINPRLVLARITGFGQFGPYASRPGFGTLAEAMSGFAAITGEADGPPTLPPFGLADGIAGITGAYAIMAALMERERSGKGQSIDISLIEPILTVLGPQIITYDQLGILQERFGNRSRNNAPRNTYRTSDGKWVAISTSSQQIAERVATLIGRPDFIAEPWYRSASGRGQHNDEVDKAVADWIAQRTRAEVIDAFEKAEAAVAPIYDAAEVMADPQIKAIDAIVSVDDDELGAVRMQNVPFRLSRTPGRIRSTGTTLGRHNSEIYGRLGYSPDELKALAEKQVI
jgi:formyl-CoA transferase